MPGVRLIVLLRFAQLRCVEGSCEVSVKFSALCVHAIRDAAKARGELLVFALHGKVLTHLHQHCELREIASRGSYLIL
jgi:hypothetical protein